MKLKEKISLEKIFEKEYKDKLVEPKNNKEAVITHFLHNSKNTLNLLIFLMYTVGNPYRREPKVFLSP